jgi:hypothetical protein
VFRLPLRERVAVALAPGEHLEYAWLSRAAAAARVGSATNRAAILALVPE